MENKNNTKLDDNQLKQAAGGYYGGFPYIDQWKCARCGYCTTICPAGAITYDGSDYHINQDECFLCGKCVNDCVFDAISSEG
ncbi:MAG: 4Fe-4S binding protein [Solobacterium sp.]|nr:4Fe-4S binding protein [Solobacterium sp.]